MKEFLAILGAITVVVLIAILLAGPTQYLWNNCLVPAINGFCKIGFWQAMGLNCLFSIMFKSTSTSKN